MKQFNSILLILIAVLFFSCRDNDSEDENLQSYFPLLNNSSWNIVSVNVTGNEYLVIESGIDVVIGPYTYKKFTDPTIYSADNYIREDIANKRVYRNVDGEDQLLYDFNLEVSDTITLGDGFTYEVISVSETNVLDGVRKRIDLVYYKGSLVVRAETWIEGVGNTIHPLKPSYEIIFSDPPIYLLCSAQNGINIYNNGIANGQPEPTDCSIL